MVRYAFTMIELIFALVIMGVVFITLPLILINDSSNVEQNLMQEAIFASSTKMAQILTYPWDENSADPGAVLTTSDVLEVTSTSINQLDRNSSDFRIGHIKQPLHRRMTPAGAIRSASLIAQDGLDDIDDFHGAGANSLISLTSDAGYKKTYRTVTTVMYVNDQSFIAPTTDYTPNTINFFFEDNTTAITAPNTTNIKMVQVSTEQNTSNTWEPILVLRAYSANIGETDFYKRTY